MTLDIIMPFYGRFDQFVVAVESVLAQTDPRWRLVIVDDHYPEPEPGQWAQTLDDPRIHYHRNHENLGVSGSFRKAVDMMTAEHAVIMGCDDVLLPHYVSWYHELAESHPDTDVMQPGVEVIDDEGIIVRPLADRVKAAYRPRMRGQLKLSGAALAASLARGNWAYFPSLIWRVSTIRRIGFRPDLEVALDLALLFEITSQRGTLVLDNVVAFQYRRHASSVSAFTATDGTRFIEERDVLLKAADRFAANGWLRADRIARLHLSSRLNALSVLPRAIRSGSPQSRRILAEHILGRRPRPTW